jgi:hypothetical protein
MDCYYQVLSGTIQVPKQSCSKKIPKQSSYKYRSYLEGGVSVSLYSLRPKIFAPFDFYRARLNIRFIQKICANVKIIMIYLKYI